MMLVIVILKEMSIETIDDESVLGKVDDDVAAVITWYMLIILLQSLSNFIATQISLDIGATSISYFILATSISLSYCTIHFSIHNTFFPSAFSYLL